jgi:hypothetical protein
MNQKNFLNLRKEDEPKVIIVTKEVPRNLFRETGKILGAVVLVGLVVWGVSHAGSLTPSSAPSASSYTLGDIYNRLTTNTTATAGNHSLSTSTTPASTFHTLTEIYSAIPTIDPSKVLSGTTYLGVAGNASAGSNYAVSGPFVSDGASDNGYLDQNTGLIWENTDAGQYLCWDGNQGCSAGNGAIDINGDGSVLLGAVEYCQYLDADGVTVDTSPQNVWHLPSIKELTTTIDYSLKQPASALPNTASNDGYWASTEYAPYTVDAWYVNSSDGGLYYDYKDNYYLARCVR